MAAVRVRVSLATIVARLPRSLVDVNGTTLRPTPALHTAARPSCLSPSLTAAQPWVEHRRSHASSAEGEKESASQSQTEGKSTNSTSSDQKKSDGQHGGRKTPSFDYSSKVREQLNKAKEKLRAARLQEVSKNVKQGFEWLKTELNRGEGESVSRGRSGSFKKTDVTAVVVGEKKTSAWEERWQQVRSKVEGTAAFQKLKKWSTPIMEKSQEVAEDMRERWETSDSPVVHKIQDLNESLFGETAQAAAMRIIKSRDPTFSLPVFIREVEASIRPTLTAYLEGDLAYLRSKCRKEVVERCTAERRALEVQGLTQLSRILHVTEAEVRETKMLQRDPIIIVGFRSQQTLCLIDKAGKVVEGGKDDILTVYHAWAMQLSSPDEEDAQEVMSYLPVWKLREMQQLGMQALI